MGNSRLRMARSLDYGLVPSNRQSANQFTNLFIWLNSLVSGCGPHPPSSPYCNRVIGPKFLEFLSFMGANR